MCENKINENIPTELTVSEVVLKEHVEYLDRNCPKCTTKRLISDGLDIVCLDCLHRE